MYRSQGDSNYPFENVNAANLGGVLRYLHDEVVTTCPRKFSITRIIRFTVTVSATPAVLETHTGPFGPYVAFDAGKCTVPNCPNIWAKYGYVVGCQRQGTSVANYPEGVWYSIPGPCPSQDFVHKSAQCRRHYTGGHCAYPNGAHDCTVHAEYSGQINLDDLSGIGNFNARCNQGVLEYNQTSDSGFGTNFWNGKRDAASCAQRKNRVLQLFKARYPHMPTVLPEPRCDW